MTSVGELFVSLGVKGSDKAMGAITGVKDGLKGIASTSLETKAAIVGAIYALERLFQSSGQRGTALENFSALTGMAQKTVQQYQWAAQQVGVSNEEMNATFIALQKNMTKTLLGKGAAEGLGVFARDGGKVTSEDIAEYQKHPELLFQKLREFVLKEKNEGLRNWVGESMGLGDNVIAGMARGGFTPEVLAKAPTYSDKEVGQLDKANVGWKNLATSVEMMFGRLNAKHGVEIVNDIQKLIPPIEKVINSLVKFSEKVHLFEGLQAIFEGVAKAIDWLASSISAIVNSKGFAEFVKLMGSIGSSVGGLLSKVPVKEIASTVGEKVSNFGQQADESLKYLNNTTPEQIKKDLLGNTKTAEGKEENTLMFGMAILLKKLMNNPQNKSFDELFKEESGKKTLPNAPANHTHASTQNVTVNQNMTFQNDGSDHKEVGKAANKGVHNAYRQISSLTRVT